VDPKRVVAEGYDRLCQIYAAWAPAEHDGLRRRYIDRLFDLGLALPASALDLGCGTGRHATSYMVARGLEVTGVDLSPRSVEVARREVAGARFVVGDMTSIDLPASSFDVVTAFYSLIHVPREDQGAVLAGIGSWLRPGGYLVAVMGGGDHPDEGVEEAWLDAAPMYWSSWDASTNRHLVAGAGFGIVEANLERLDEDGRETTFLWVVARKPGERRP
jgi:SAM-dependent methyltransferase